MDVRIPMFWQSVDAEIGIQSCKFGAFRISVGFVTVINGHTYSLGTHCRAARAIRRLNLTT
ncbi:hypothetical protein [Actinoplanes sp. L3-i22]|uniref:hypothetical protein n=1 Tax=Actinoplanes sp. L3-i22 TaxID=2836373 RepID=UPI001C85E2B2|nr:hypothetical protein [Actinoplanes sp. L3-i22]